MKLLLASLLLATVAEASPKCPSPRIHTHRALAAAKDSLESVPPQAAPDLANQGAAFFVDVPLGSPNGSDAVDANGNQKDDPPDAHGSHEDREHLEP